MPDRIAAMRARSVSRSLTRRDICAISTVVRRGVMRDRRVATATPIHAPNRPAAIATSSEVRRVAMA
jgi:hypothetical protein